jgi:RNA polymerase sigma-70 factor, ECF subfamily
MSKRTDNQLVNDYLLGDANALDVLVKRYLGSIFGYVRKFTGNRDDAADITQETFVKVWKKLKSYDQNKSFKSWIFTIAKNTAIDWLRCKKYIFLDPDLSGSIADESPSIQEKVDNTKKLRLALAAFSEIPVNYSEIIKLRHDKEMSFGEIANFLEKPLNTVKSQYRRGVAKLRNILNK